MANIYNSYDDIITYEYKQKEIKGVKIGFYDNWGINGELVNIYKLSI